MKKQLLLLVMILLPMVAMADPVEIDGIYYNLISKTKTAEVTSNSNGYSGDILIPSTVCYNSESYAVKKILSCAFAECQINSIIISEGIDYIGEKSFRCCSIKSITIPKTLNKIDMNAFENCNLLAEVHITDLEAWCNIDYNQSEYDMYYNPYYTSPLYYAHHLFLNDEEITDLVIPNTLSSIKHLSFMGGSFKSITIPPSIETIEWGAFYGCYNITSITLPIGLTSIGMGAFWGCRMLESISLPVSITRISEATFRDCSNLRQISLSNNIDYIGAWAFSGCEKLEEISLPIDILSIEDYTFSGCRSLTSVIIPNKVTEIKQSAFSNCSNLKTIYFGESVYSIATSFDHCKELKDVFCYSDNVPSTQSTAFEGSYIEYATLHVPDASINAYSQVEPWKNFKEVVGLNGTPPSTEKCAKPTISYINGKLKFTSSTEGAEYIYEIQDEDVKKGYVDEVQLTATYHISVCAIKSGYDDSDVATATLCWIDKEPTITTDVMQIPSKAVLIQSEDGIFTIQGIDDGTQVSVYDVDGTEAGRTVSRNGGALISTNLRPGSIAIVKISEKSVKVIVK